MKRTVYPAILMIFALCMITPGESQAQDRINWDKVLKDWSAGVHVGATMPYTDVRSYDWFRKTKPKSEYQYGFGANITKMMGGVFGIQARYTYGKLQGFSNFDSEFTEDYQFWELVGVDKPFYFSTNFHAPSVNVYINFSNMFLGLNRKIRSEIKDEALKERRVSVYGRAGIGALWFDSELRDIETDALVGNQFGRGFSGSAVEVSFPFALGMKFKVTKLIDINIEGEFTFVHDDKLDALIVEDLTKDDYLLDFDNADIPSDRVRNSLGGRYDKFLTVNAGVQFKFGTLKSQDEHIEWVNPLEAYMDANDAKVQYLLDNMYEVKDADGDGVIDELDEEPNTPEGATVDTKGRTLDSDGDGIADYEDPEPYSSPAFDIKDGKNVYPETWTPDEIREYVETTIRTSAPKSAGWAMSLIFFDLDQAKIKSEMIPELYKVASTMKKYPDMKVNVKGHTDIRFTDEYNQKLSEKRTQAAIDYMVENYGLSRDRFIPAAFGESETMISNAKREAEHLLNRRVEFTPANY